MRALCNIVCVVTLSFLDIPLSTGMQGELVYDVYLWLCFLLGKVTIFL
jgi:hypothetical protein